MAGPMKKRTKYPVRSDADGVFQHPQLSTPTIPQPIGKHAPNEPQVVRVF